MESLPGVRSRVSRSEPEKPFPNRNFDMGGVNNFEGVSDLINKIDRINEILEENKKTDGQRNKEYTEISDIVYKIQKFKNRPAKGRLEYAKKYYEDSLTNNEKKKLVDLGLNVEIILGSNFNLYNWEGIRSKRLTKYEIDNYNEQLKNLQNQLAQLQKINQDKIAETNSKRSATQNNGIGGGSEKIRTSERWL